LYDESRGLSVGDLAIGEGGMSAGSPTSTRALLRADLDLDRPLRQWVPELLTVRAISTILFRLSQVLGAHVPLAAYVVKQVNHILTGADLAWQASVGPGLTLYHPTGVVLGPDVVVGSDCVLQQGVTLGAVRQRGRMADGRMDSPRVGNAVSVGSGGRLLGPISVGDGAVIGANAVVLQDVPAGHLAVGVPARMLPRSSDV
jgi:serine O-acetyltransferase